MTTARRRRIEKRATAHRWEAYRYVHSGAARRHTSHHDGNPTPHASMPRTPGDRSRARRDGAASHIGRLVVHTPQTPARRPARGPPPRRPGPAAIVCTVGGRRLKPKDKYRHAYPVNAICVSYASGRKVVRTFRRTYSGRGGRWAGGGEGARARSVLGDDPAPRVHRGAAVVRRLAWCVIQGRFEDPICRHI